MGKSPRTRKEEKADGGNSIHGMLHTQRRYPGFALCELEGSAVKEEAERFALHAGKRITNQDCARKKKRKKKGYIYLCCRLALRPQGDSESERLEQPEGVRAGRESEKKIAKTGEDQSQGDRAERERSHGSQPISC